MISWDFIISPSPLRHFWQKTSSIFSDFSRVTHPHTHTSTPVTYLCAGELLLRNQWRWITSFTQKTTTSSFLSIGFNLMMIYISICCQLTTTWANCLFWNTALVTLMIHRPCLLIDFIRTTVDWNRHQWFQWNVLTDVPVDDPERYFVWLLLMSFFNVQSSTNDILSPFVVLG